MGSDFINEANSDYIHIYINTYLYSNSNFSLNLCKRALVLKFSYVIFLNMKCFRMYIVASNGCIFSLLRL